MGSFVSKVAAGLPASPQSADPAAETVDRSAPDVLLLRKRIPSYPPVPIAAPPPAPPVDAGPGLGLPVPPSLPPLRPPVLGGGAERPLVGDSEGVKMRTGERWAKIEGDIKFCRV